MDAFVDLACRPAPRGRLSILLWPDARRETQLSARPYVREPNAAPGHSSSVLRCRPENGREARTSMSGGSSSMSGAMPIRRNAPRGSFRRRILARVLHLRRPCVTTPPPGVFSTLAAGRGAPSSPALTPPLRVAARATRARPGQLVAARIGGKRRGLRFLHSANGFGVKLLTAEEIAVQLGVPAKWPLQQAAPATCRTSSSAATCASTRTT